MFGKVISGFEHCKDIEKMEIDSQDKPKEKVMIVDCGELVDNAN